MLSSRISVNSNSLWHYFVSVCRPLQHEGNFLSTGLKMSRNSCSASWGIAVRFWPSSETTNGWTLRSWTSRSFTSSAPLLVFPFLVRNTFIYWYFLPLCYMWAASVRIPAWTVNYFNYFSHSLATFVHIDRCLWGCNRTLLIILISPACYYNFLEIATIHSFLYISDTIPDWCIYL